MAKERIGIIGGTGLGDKMLAEVSGETVAVDTPFGLPSASPILAEWGDLEVVFLARHGEGHRFNPSSVPYRANIWALKSLGVSTIIASGATGSLREDISPGHLVLCDQVIDKTIRRSGTFFDENVVVHVELAEPFCPCLRKMLIGAGSRINTTVHDGGTYICMEGPQFSTRAESLMHRQWGGDLIGMTCMPEAKLAREAEMCYALVALPTDYDCWRATDASREQADLLQEILGNLRRATDAAYELIVEALKHVESIDVACSCRDALKLAIWSDKQKIDKGTRDRLGLLLEKHL